MTNAETVPNHPAPNHHASYGGCSGFLGGLAGISMLFGRTDEARLAAELAELRPDDVVLDVGCGPGVAARAAARRGARVVGVDPSPVMLRLGRRFNRDPGVEYVDGVAESLPVPDSSASVLWSIATVHHWQDVGAGIREARRVLASGGRLVAIEHLTTPGARGHASHGWTEAQANTFAACLREHGFADVAVARHRGRRRPSISVRAVAP